MKKANFILILSLVIGLFTVGIRAEYMYHKNKEYIENIELLMMDLIVTDSNRVDIKVYQWHLLIDAMIEKESRGKEDAVGKTNDIGVLQITPIYVEEVNRILGEQKYTLKDRYDKYKSIEMFNIMNEKHNPDKCFNKAIQLHNPKAPRSYKLDILENYYRLLKNNKIIW